MKPIQAFKNIISGLYLSLKRFPLTILLSFLVASILVIISETKPSQDILSQLAMTVALGIPLTLCIKLFFESREYRNNLILYSYYLAGAVLLILYYLFLLNDFNMVAVTRYIAVSLALYLSFIFIPFSVPKKCFENYVISLLSGFFITILYCIVLNSGLAAILFAIDKLLGIRIQSEIYYYTFLYVIFLFGVSYFLATIPKIGEDLSARSYPKLLKILFLYIVMPLISIYTIILYIYFAKILITTQWPANIITNLVLWYSVISVVVIFFITPLALESKWSKSFTKFFPKLILPVLAMMFISIFLRINAYGVTEKRYYVTVLALWVFAMMLYLGFVKKSKNIIIFISLSIICLISVFGPLSSYSVSKMSQNKRLEQLLARNNMIKDGIIQPNSNVTKKDRADISSILQYFKEDHSFKAAKHLPENFTLDNMSNTFGFAYEAPEHNFQNNYFYFSTEGLSKTIDITSYDYLMESVAAGGRSNIDKNSLYISYSPDSSIVSINKNGKEIYSKDFKTLILGLAEKYSDRFEKGELPIEEMTFIDENENVNIKFIFRHISGTKEASNQAFSNIEMNFYVLLKLK